MYSSVEKNHEKVEVSLVQIISAGIIVMVALVLPAQQLYTEQQAAAIQTTLASGQSVVTSNNQTSNIAPNTLPSAETVNTANTQNNNQQATNTTQPSTGRVAGATTNARLFTIPLINVTIDMSDQSQLLYVVGGALIIFSLLLLFFATEPKKQELKLPPHWR